VPGALDEQLELEMIIAVRHLSEALTAKPLQSNGFDVQYWTDSQVCFR
jgi:hypothetical protein